MHGLNQVATPRLYRRLSRCRTTYETVLSMVKKTTRGADVGLAYFTWPLLMIPLIGAISTLQSSDGNQERFSKKELQEQKADLEQALADLPVGDGMRKTLEGQLAAIKKQINEM